MAREHPDAKTTKRSEEEIVFEFVDALELNHYLNVFNFCCLHLTFFDIFRVIIKARKSQSKNSFNSSIMLVQPYKKINYLKPFSLAALN